MRKNTGNQLLTQDVLTVLEQAELIEFSCRMWEANMGELLDRVVYRIGSAGVRGKFSGVRFEK